MTKLMNNEALRGVMEKQLINNRKCLFSQLSQLVDDKGEKIFCEYWLTKKFEIQEEKLEK